MDFCDRLKQEVSACRCAKDAMLAIEDHRKQLERLNETARAQLFAELIDIMRELPSA